MIRVRASAMPRIATCAASAHQVGTVQIDMDNDAARLGTAVHDVLRRCFDADGSMDGIDLTTYEVDQDDLRFLTFQGLAVLDRYGHLFEGGYAETNELEVEIVPGVMLTGHLDLLRFGPIGEKGTRTVYVLDYKSGRVDRDHGDQLIAYAALAEAMADCVDRIVLIVAHLRSGETEMFEISPTEIAEWKEQRGFLILNGQDKFSISDEHCGLCPWLQECPAHALVARRTVQAVVAPEWLERLEGGLPTWTPDMVILARDRLAMVADLAKKGLEAIRRHAIAQGGVEGTDSELTVTSIPRAKFNVAKVWPILRDHNVHVDAMLAQCSLSKDGLFKAVSTAAEKKRGAAKALYDEVVDELQEAGAMTETRSARVEKRRRK